VVHVACGGTKHGRWVSALCQWGWKSQFEFQFRQGGNFANTYSLLCCGQNIHASEKWLILDKGFLNWKVQFANSLSSSSSCSASTLTDRDEMWYVHWFQIQWLNVHCPIVTTADSLYDQSTTPNRKWGQASPLKSCIASLTVTVCLQFAVQVFGAWPPFFREGIA